VPSLPSTEVLAIWSVVAVGLLAGARRLGLYERAYRSVWLRWQPRTADGRVAAEGAFARVEYVLSRRARAREPGETVREYLAAVDADERATEVAAVRERARYGGDLSETDVERARRLAAAYVSERTGVATLFNRLPS
jgi:hypothetical protein